MKYKLSEVAYYSKEKIKTDELSPENYLSTENMLPEFGGITTASSLPTISTVTKYRPGDILLSNIRPYFKKLYYSMSEGGCSNDVLCFCAKDNINKAFLYYSLKNDDFFKYVMATAKGTKMPRGDKSAIMDYELEVPDLETQKKIVRILSVLDQKIMLNITANNYLFGMAESLFDNIYKTGTKRKLGDLLSNIESGSRPKGGAEKRGIPSIGAEKIERFGIYDYSTEKYISEEYFSKMKRGLLKNKDVLLYKDGAYTGKSSMCLNGFPHNRAAINEHVFILNTENNEAQFYLYFCINNKQNKKVLYDIASSKAAQPGLNQSEVSALDIYIASDQKIRHFEESVTPLMNRIALNALQNHKLATIRNTLLPRLVSCTINANEVH